MSKQALAVKHRPKRFSDVVEQDVPKAILTEQLKNKSFKNCLLFCGGAGTGKAQPLYSKVLTPDGFITMGEVTVGTYVITGNGNVALVSGVYPQGVRPIYEITLSNGCKFRVSDEHLNVIFTETPEDGFVESVVTTTELLKLKRKETFIRITNSRGKTSAYYNISSIKHIGDEECQCIYVDATEHTYITDNYVITHNTTSARIFGKEINDFKGHIIEIDAASHNGVDDVRRIIEDARTQSLDSEYKVFVIDECFHKDTLISTPDGDKKISEIQIGDYVYTKFGIEQVDNVFCNQVAPERLLLVHLSNGDSILTTVDHLFFTYGGWKDAKELKTGDVLFDSKNLCDLWKRIPILSERQADGVFCRMWKNLSETENFGNFTKEEEKVHTENMSNMSETLYNISFREFQDLWKGLCIYLHQTEWVERKTKEFILSILDGLSVSRMWQDYEGENKEESKILFKRMCPDTSETNGRGTFQAECGSCLCYMWQYIFKEYFQQYTDLLSRMYISVPFTEVFQTLFREQETADVTKQSNVESTNNTEDVINKGEKRESSCVEWSSWWKWTLHRTSNDVVCQLEGELGSGVSSQNIQKNGFGISYELQVRPCLTHTEVGCRGRWDEPFFEIGISTGFQESEFVEPIRVDSIEVYKRGDNEQSFQGYFTNRELHADFVNMYDLQVRNHSSYFANNVLVHNCHMISNAGWNAALKLVEEPPKKSVLIFCTTDPQKIPATILSRVQRFNFQKISLEGIIGRLKYIIESENNDIIKESQESNPPNEDPELITYEDSAIEYIAKQADGGMRDSITLLDKCIGYNKNLTLPNVLEALGSVDYDTMFSLTNALDVMDGKKFLEIMENIHKSGLDLKQFVKQYIYFVLDLCKYEYFRNFEHLQMPTVYEDNMKSYKDEDFAFFRQLLDVVISLNKEIQWETVPRPLIECRLLRLCSED